ncbi:hypothetical protein AM593_10088, partial [Mytilus galloprovincialis]
MVESSNPACIGFDFDLISLGLPVFLRRSAVLPGHSDFPHSNVTSTIINVTQKTDVILLQMRQLSTHVQMQSIVNITANTLDNNKSIIMSSNKSNGVVPGEEAMPINEDDTEYKKLYELPTMRYSNIVILIVTVDTIVSIALWVT